jgi:hypothetical protein
MGPPEIEVHEHDGPDRSWALDLQNLVDHVTHGVPLLGDLGSARYAMHVVDEAYRTNGFAVPDGRDARPLSRGGSRRILSAYIACFDRPRHCVSHVRNAGPE